MKSGFPERWEAVRVPLSQFPKVICPTCKREVADVNGKYSYHGPGATQFACPGSLLNIPANERTAR